jgi:hypothetical protein
MGLGVAGVAGGRQRYEHYCIKMVLQVLQVVASSAF